MFNTTRITILALIAFLSFSHVAQSQNSLSQMSQLRIKTNQQGMLARGAWAAGNLLVGANRFDKPTENQYFYRMNMYVNIVNLGVATSGYLNSIGQSFENLTDEEKLEKQYKTEKFLLLNVGLDVAYVATGVYLMDRGVSESSYKTKGYGKSLLMQGGFLLLLDTALYIKHNSNRKKYGKYQIVPSTNANGVGLIFRLR